CADVAKSPEAQAEALEVNDPLEPVNRVVFDVNDFLDRLLVKPLTELYRFVTPGYLRERVANIIANMNEPVIFANNLMQGETTAAGITAQRFVVNTTAGAGGIFEVAEDLDLQKQRGDFGQTLHVWGVSSGPYLVLPLFGPSTFRDAVGLGVDMVMSPWQWIAAAGGKDTKNALVYSSFAADGLTRREQNLEAYDALRSGALDFYAEMRSVYRQYRNKQLGIQPPDTSKLFDFQE
ncbi:MAG: VacJ family lipoprotein, partial [Alphaproteobacteria bacterium]|nr:VacJ family lipoprotein [Alphaproteobacteria bacterium]